MMKIYSLALSLVTALAMFAVAMPASATQHYAPYGQNKDSNSLTRLTKGESKSRNLQPTGISAKAFAPVAKDTQIIPDGEELLYESDRICIMHDYIVDNTGLAGYIRYCDNSKLYFKDMFSLGEDFYFEATIDDNGLITIPTHQFFFENPEDGKVTLEISKFSTLPNGNTTSDIFRDKDAYYLQRHEDGTITSLDGDKDWMDREYLVLCNQWDEVFALSGNIVMRPVTDKLVTPPADIEPLTYNFKYIDNGEIYAQMCDVVINDNDVYIQGLCYYFPDSWVKATFNDDHTKLIMKSGQFIGNKLYVNYFSAAHRTSVEIDGEPQLIWEKDPEMVLNVDQEGTTFTFPRGQYFAITIAGDVDYTIHSGSLTPYKEMVAKPATPTLGGMWWIGFNALYFTIPTFDVDGNYIDPKNLSWRLYYDDELFTFDPSEYGNLEEPMTDIPYEFIDNYDFGVHYGEKYVAIYKNDYKTIGIESVCTVEGQSKTSDRVYHYNDSDGVSSPIETKTVTSSEIYNLSGQKVSGKLAPGLYIRTDTYSDGSKRSVKTIVR